MYSFRMRSPRTFLGLAIVVALAATLIVVLSSGGG